MNGGLQRRFVINHIFSIMMIVLVALLVVFFLSKKNISLFTLKKNVDVNYPELVDAVSWGDLDNSEYQVITKDVLFNVSTEVLHENVQLKLLSSEKKPFDASSISNFGVIGEPDDSMRELEEVGFSEEEISGLSLSESNKFSIWLLEQSVANPDFDYAQEIRRHFENDRDGAYLDYDAALYQENNYLDLFSTRPELSGFALREVKCFVSNCRLSIAITDIEQANSMVEKISSSINKDGLSIFAVPNEYDAVTMLYITEGG